MSRYDEIMDQVRVTDELRSRILDRMSRETAAPVRSVPWRPWMGLAASAALVLAGGFGLWQEHRVPLTPEPERPGVVQTRPEPEARPDRPAGVTGMPPPGLTGALPPQTVSMESLEELAGAVPFPLEKLSTLPFEPVDIRYVLRDGEMAEILYAGEEDRAVYRRSPGTEDNSGDYGPYADTVTLESEGVSMTLQGENGRFSLGTWTDGTWVSSLRLSTGQELSWWQHILNTL